MKPIITADCVKTLLDTRFIKVFDLQYEEGKHYYDATRRAAGNLVAVKSDAEAAVMLPDAVSCFVIIRLPDGDDRLLLTWEYRYPAGRFLLGVTAGLLDPEDQAAEQPLLSAAARELKEETGLDILPGDTMKVVSPFVYSTPGMTDESNGLACIVLRRQDLSGITQDGAVGSECFEGYVALTRDEARQALESGRDPHGHFYSVYTWCALMYFLHAEL